MKLLTKAIEKTIPALYSTMETALEDKTIVCKYFAIGSGWTWYVVEGERREDGDFLFYGLVEGHEREWGYFALSEMEALKWHGIPGIERDLYFKPVKVSECREIHPKPHKGNYMDDLMTNLRE